MISSSASSSSISGEENSDGVVGWGSTGTSKDVYFLVVAGSGVDCGSLLFGIILASSVTIGGMVGGLGTFGQLPL